jgi:hypothetical protein
MAAPDPPSYECPLRLTCANTGLCPGTEISFDTVDGYPRTSEYPYGIVDNTPYGTVGAFPDSLGVIGFNDVSNSWPLWICDTSGAERDANGALLPADAHRIDVLARVIVNNTSRVELVLAAKEFPDAAWADAFRDEAASQGQRPLLAGTFVQSGLVINGPSGQLERRGAKPTAADPSASRWRRKVALLSKIITG